VRNSHRQKEKRGIYKGLEEKTLAKACGIELKGFDKWKTLIENASMSAKAL
jgi:hypothetical protein